MKIRYIVNMAGSSIINIGDVADLSKEAAERLIEKGCAEKFVDKKVNVKKAVISKSTVKSKKK